MESAHDQNLDTRGAWLEIDLARLRRNIRAYKALLKPATRLMCVVKADAYGHGASACAKVMSSSGAQQFAVATVDEGIALRTSGIKLPIVILSQPPLDAIDDLLEYQLIPLVYDTYFVLQYAEHAVMHDMVGKYHLAIDSGMTRIGVVPEEASAFRKMVDFHRGITCVGTCTHFATADTRGDWDFRRQYQAFCEALRSIKREGFNTGLIHCNNTAATMLHPELQFDMCRVGIGLYGLYPGPDLVDTLDLMPVMSVRARIMRVKTCPIGTGVGYGMTYRVSEPNMQIATIPIGYADGLSRSLSNKMDVLVHGKRAHQVGRICMDQAMFAYPLAQLNARAQLAPLEVGDIVTIMGEDGQEYIGADEIASLRDTINYEVVCNFSARLKRHYI